MKCDVVIIGASIAGSAAAAMLGARGLSVLLFDRSTFPRRKPCGEGLSNLGVAVASRNSLWPAELSAHALPYQGYQLQAGTRTRTIELRSGGGVTVQRERLDATILNCALRHPTVQARLGTSVDTVDPTGEVQTASERVHARHILIADGSNSPTARLLNLSTMRSGPARMGATATFEGRFAAPPTRVHILIEDGFEIYCTPLPYNRLNLSVVAPHTRDSVNLRTLLLDGSVQQRAFESIQFQGKCIAAPLGRAPIGNLVRTAVHDHCLLIGDACEEFDPIGGMGMTHALSSAELAAQAILAIESGLTERTQALRRYTLLREQAARSMRRFTRFTYRMLRLAQRYPRLLDVAASPLGSFVAHAFSPKEIHLL